MIAEISANHNGSIKQAKKLIDLAKKSGANAVKLQTYTPEMMTLRETLLILKLMRVYGKVTIFGIYIL